MSAYDNDYGYAVTDASVSTYHRTPGIFGNDAFRGLCGEVDLVPVVSWEVVYGMGECAACTVAMAGNVNHALIGNPR